MGRGLNSFNLAAGFNITGQQPIDSRLVVDNVADLYLADTWSGVGLYNGLVVAIKSTGALFVLKDRDNYTNTASWVAVGGDVTADISDLTARIGVIETKVTPSTTSGLDVKDGALAVKIDTSSDNALKVSESGLKVVASVYDLQPVESPDAAYASQYVFSKDGATVTTINIPKDQFLKDASFITATAEDVAFDSSVVEGDPYLKFVWQIDTDPDVSGVQPTTYVPVKSLVDVYTSADNYVRVTENAISLNYGVLQNQLADDFKIGAINQSISKHETELYGDNNNGLVVRVQNVEEAIGNLQDTNTSLTTKVDNNSTLIQGIIDSINDCQVKRVDTNETYGISLTHTNVLGADDINDTVGINVDIDTLAAAVIAKHAVPTPDASAIKVVATADSSFTNDTTVQAAIINLDSRIKAATVGGVTGINGGVAITVSGESTNPTVSVNIAKDSAIQVVDNQIDIYWSEL